MGRATLTLPRQMFIFILLLGEVTYEYVSDLVQVCAHICLCVIMGLQKKEHWDVITEEQGQTYNAEIYLDFF